MSDYPVGATWEAVDCVGSRGKVFLKERYSAGEIWEWEFEYVDGSRPDRSFDWGTNRRMVVEACSAKLLPNPETGKRPRFKRVK